MMSAAELGDRNADEILSFRSACSSYDLTSQTSIHHSSSPNAIKRKDIQHEINNHTSESTHGTCHESK